MKSCFVCEYLYYRNQTKYLKVQNVSNKHSSIQLTPLTSKSLNQFASLNNVDAHLILIYESTKQPQPENPASHINVWYYLRSILLTKQRFLLCKFILVYSIYVLFHYFRFMIFCSQTNCHVTHIDSPTKSNSPTLYRRIQGYCKSKRFVDFVLLKKLIRILITRNNKKNNTNVSKLCHFAFKISVLL